MNAVGNNLVFLQNRIKIISLKKLVKYYMILLKGSQSSLIKYSTKY